MSDLALSTQARHAAEAHQHNLDRLRHDPRSRRVVPISPRGRGVPLLVDGAVYCRFVDRVNALAALDALKERWPAAQGRTLTVAIEGPVS